VHEIAMNAASGIEGVQAPRNSIMVFLDFIRGISAIAVCAGHLRAAMIVDYANANTSSIFSKLFYLATGLGHQAVMVFFVLSGYFVGGSILRNKAAFKWSQYGLTRLTRLWIVLIPGLLLTAMIDQLISRVDSTVFEGAYWMVWNSGPSPDKPYSESLSTLLGNIAFLQTIEVPVFGTNAPLWSLANEFWYYLLFPMLLHASREFSVLQSSVWKRMLYPLLALLILLWLPGSIRQGFLIWCLGVLVWISSTSTFMRRFASSRMLGALIFFAALGYSKSAGAQAYIRIPGDYVVGLGFAFLALAISVHKPRPDLQRSLFGRLACFLSDFSYSLYVVHFPVVIAISVICYHSGKAVPDAITLLQYAFWLCLLIAIGIAFWWAFESRTKALRRLFVSH